MKEIRKTTEREWQRGRRIEKHGKHYERANDWKRLQIKREKRTWKWKNRK